METRLSVALEMKDGIPQKSQSLDDAIWAVQHWGVQGITVAGFAQGNASDASKETALAIAQFVVAELAKQGVRANAILLAPERSRGTGATAVGVEFEIVRGPRRNQTER